MNQKLPDAQSCKKSYDYLAPSFAISKKTQFYIFVATGLFHPAVVESFSMSAIGVIGWGYVGQATGVGFSRNKKNKVYWYDKYKESPNTFEEVIDKSEFIFVCVPTPMFRDYSGMDISIVKDVVGQIAPHVKNSSKVIIIKSTVLPGTTSGLAKKYPKVLFAMNPEFLTQENANVEFLKPVRTILGVSDKKVGDRLIKLYRTILPKEQPYFILDLTEAELAKYMSNLILASKVLLANEFYMLSRKIGVNYDLVRKSVEADPRVGTHLKVPGPDGDFGFGGACFAKDMLGLLTFAKEKRVDVSALDAIWEKNLKIRKNRDWEKRENSFGRATSENK